MRRAQHALRRRLFPSVCVKELERRTLLKEVYMKIPGFTAEQSDYKTSRHSQMNADFKRTGRTIHPALLGETEKPVGWQVCVDQCFGKCVKNKGCNQMAPSAQVTCKNNCEQKCMSDCTGLGGFGSTTKLTCDIFSNRWFSCAGIAAWETGCFASIFGGPWCKVAANEMRAQSHCEVC